MPALKRSPEPESITPSRQSSWARGNGTEGKAAVIKRTDTSYRGGQARELR
jgi:hypothetical protein